jgi:hypothetical protein
MRKAVYVPACLIFASITARRMAFCPGLDQIETALNSCWHITPALVLGEHPLPVPLLVRIAVLAVERPGSLHTSVRLNTVLLVQASLVP